MIFLDLLSMLGSRVIAISTQLHVIEPCHAAPFVCPVVSRLHLVASSAVASSCANAVPADASAANADADADADADASASATPLTSLSSLFSSDTETLLSSPHSLSFILHSSL